MNRGEKEGFLSVKIEGEEEKLLQRMERRLIRRSSDTADILRGVIADSYKRLIAPSLEREIRNDLTEKAEEAAIGVFRENLRQLLLQPPISGKVVLALDPAYRTGCKIAVIDTTGKPLETTVVYPTPPQNKTAEAEKKLLALIEEIRRGFNLHRQRHSLQGIGAFCGGNAEKDKPQGAVYHCE